MQVDAATMSRLRLLMEEAAEIKRTAEAAHADSTYRCDAYTRDYEAARERYIAYLEGQATIMEGA